MKLRSPILRQSRSWLTHRKSPHAGDIRTYREFVISVGTQIGELTPLEHESITDIRHMVRTAAWSLGLRCRTWVDDGKVYFFVVDTPMTEPVLPAASRAEVRGC